MTETERLKEKNSSMIVKCYNQLARASRSCPLYERSHLSYT